MNIMIDYDKTFTANTFMFAQLILMMQMHKNKIFLVTSRDENDVVEHIDFFNDKGVEVIYCDYRAKRKVCEERGIKIDVWIDDTPYYIDHDFLEDEADKWRATHAG